MKFCKNANSVYDLVYVSSPQYVEERRSIFYIKTSLSREKNDYVADILEYHLDTNETTSHVANGYKNTYPSVQGNRLLYLSNKNDKQTPQAYVLNLETSEEKQITFVDKGVLNAQWAGNTDVILFKAQADVSKQLTFKAKHAEVYNYDRLNYHADGVGFLDTRYQTFLFMQNINDHVAYPVAHQNAHPMVRSNVQTTAEGDDLVYEKPADVEDPYNFNVGVEVFETATQKRKEITQQFKQGKFGEASFSPDGNYVLMLGSTAQPEQPTHFDVYLYSRKTDEFTNLTEGMDADFNDHALTDFSHYLSQPLLQWHPNSKEFFVQKSEYGDVRLYRGDLTGTLEPVSPKQTTVKEFTVTEEGTVYATFSKYNDPVSLQCFDGSTWKRVNLPDTDFTDTDFATYHEVEYEAEDGGVIHGYVVTPPEFSTDKKYPFLLNIHGGPNMMHSSNFYHEIQHQAANGYVVLLLNPRGSFGYGHEHVMGSYGKFGQKDYTDIMAAVDCVLADFEFIDETDLYVTGGSYGGYMTNWIVTHDHRFKAAVTQRCVSNLISMVGTSDIGHFFHNDMAGADLTDAERLWEYSPLAYVQEVETPLLVMHSLEDYRCPFEQGQQMYTALKYFDKEAELLAFPESDHNLSRTGKPSYRVERLRAMMQWFETYA